MSKKVLVCGASGFIGRNIFEALSLRSDLEVFGTYQTFFTTEPSLNPRKFWTDLTKKFEACHVTKGMDVVIHAAAVTAGFKAVSANPGFFVPDNIVMNTRLLEAAYDNKVGHFIFLSCTVLYPMNLDRQLSEEDTDFNSIDPAYRIAWIKIIGEKLCEFYGNLGRTKFTVVRHSNIYGPYDKYDLERAHIFGALIARIADAPEGGNIEIWGEGSEKRDLLHVSDLVRFIETAIETEERKPCEIYNVGSGKVISVLELAEKIIQLSGKKLSITHNYERNKRPLSVAIDITKAKRMFGWEPKVTLEEGIKNTLEWYLQHKSSL